jgi:hypothetical protein
MPNQLYNGHFLIWTANHDKRSNHWIPHIIVTWAVDGKYRLHRFDGPPQMSQQEAVTLGKQFGEQWVDKEL